MCSTKDKLTRRINTNLVKKAGRSPEIIYYDVTNVYYEIEELDEDETDNAGNVITKGMRKLGVCKEERKLPIVQMGLFMDDNGIPISVETFPGNTLDHLTLRHALQKSIDNLGFSRFILISDRGMHNGMSTMHITDLIQIEDQFRVMKGTLGTRPLFVRTPEHIAAHLQICMIALILLRIIQKRLIKSGVGKYDIDAYWSTGLNGQRIQKALKKWNVDKLPDDLYRFMDIDDPDLKLILEAFDIDLPQKLYRRAELKGIKTGTSIFI